MPVIKALNRQSGFNLVEMVIGIVTFAIALTVITAVVAPQINRSVDPIYQVRATELAQSMFNEILAKYYDQKSDANGGRIRCDEDLNGDGDDQDSSEGERSCSEVLGPETGETRALFNDIDDYNGYEETATLLNSMGQDLVLDNGEHIYANYKVAVAVTYDDDQDGVANEDELPAHPLTGNIKRILVTITMPNGEEVSFSSYKHNY